MKGEKHTQALLLLFFYGISVKKAEKDLVRGLCFPHLFMFSGEKEREKEKANQVWYHWKIAWQMDN